MKKLYLILPILLFFIYGSFAQTTITTNYTAGTTTNLSGNPGVVFAIDNSNSHTVTITDIGHYTQAGNTANWTLWYNPTASLTGAPSSVTTANGWIEVTPSQSATNSGTAGIIPVLTGIEVDIPANTAYRFALVSSNGLYYGNASSAPNSFTDEGVSIWVGDNANSPGYTGAFPNMTVNTPRSFYGFITFTGEIDDCYSPGDLTLDTLMPTTAEFSWTVSPDETGGYDWVLMAQGDDPDIDTPIQSGNATGTTLLISTLTVLTDYAFFLQTNCGADGPSIWRSVEFQTPPTCPGVDNIQVYNITHQEAFVSWTETGPATSWNIEYGAPGYTPGTGTSVSTTSNPHTLTGLSMFTEYDLYVQSDCGPGDLSVWFGPFNFHTTIDCTAYALDITSTTDNSVCGGGSVTLEATASGTGTDILWYDSLTSTTPIGNGTEFQTPPISTTTSYWVAEAVASGGSLSGQGKLTNTGNSAYAPTETNDFGLLFTANEAFTIIDVEVLSAGGGGPVTVELRENDYLGNTVAIATVNVAGGGSAASPVPAVLPLNFQVPTAGTYYLAGYNGPSMIRDTGSNTFPYPLGTVGQITTGHTWTGSMTNTYYFFYNWTISSIEVECESPREEVIATVNNQADEEILTLPYTHTASTFDYDNNYSGAPGTDCGTTDSYLDGYDVVYKYTADDDYILNIELSGLTDSHTAVFIYESCMDIGNTCYAEGSVNENIGTHSFQVAVEDTKDYYIVVSSASPTDFMNYTLTVTGTTCANYPAPTGPAAQSFINTQTLADLDVTGLDLKWYSDAALANNIPNSTVLVNGTTYYVTQSFQGCESAALAITVNEAQCNLLDVLSSVDGSVCGEGSVILTAQGAGAVANTALYWYENATGGNHVGVGSQFTTPKLQQTTSYWVAEVALSGGIPGGSGAFPTYCIPTFGTGCTSSDTIDDFIIEDASGNTILSHLNSGCSPNGYGNFTADANLNPTFEAGKTYSFTATHSYSTQRMKIWIDFNKDGIFDDVDELVFTSPTGANPTIGTFTIPANVDGNITGMRVFNNYSSLPTDACTSASSFGEVHDYKVNISGASVVCESPRTEVIATVNEMADEQVTEPLPYVHTANTSVYGNNYEGEPGGNCNDGTPYLDGNETVYQYNPSVGGVYSIELSGLTSNNAAVFVYESCYDIGTNCWAGAVSDGTTGNILIDEVPMYDGFDYFIVVTTATSASTDYTLTVDLANINCSDYTAAPGGDADQFFEAGDTLDDLVVYGGNLTWYSDAAGTNVIPNTTLLVNGTTYYVKQTLNGCDSDLLGITVHEIDCSALAIVSTTDGNIVCKGVAQLEAVGNGGPGTEIYWFSSPTSVDPIAIGTTYTTPILTNTTSYWVSEVFLEQSAGSSGPLPTYCIPTFSTGCTSGDLIDDFILTDQSGATLINHIGSGCSPGGYGNFTNDSNLTATLIAGQTYDFTATANFSSQRIKIWIDLNKDGVFDDATELLYESPSGANPVIGSFTIPHNATGNTTVMRVFDRYSSLPTSACDTNVSFGEVHDYKVTIVGASMICESPRVEVFATVSQSGDKLVGALNYTDTDNTVNYGNNFSGTPGCDYTLNYLDGNDIVYKYSPVTDDIINIELTNVTNNSTGVFVYQSCGDVGTNCLAGATSVGGVYLIEDFYATGGQDYFIVISSETGSTNYTLNIYGFDCNNAATPSGDATQYFVGTKYLTDLDIDEHTYSTGLNWYEDAAGTQPINDPTTWQLVHNTTYYVSQTVLSCESDLFAITAMEFDCVDLEIITTTDGIVCQSGSVTLTAQAGGVGSDIYWYSQQNGGDPIYIGNTFVTPILTNTETYWVTEVYTESGTGSSGPLPTYCIPTFGTGCTSGDLIDDFILEDQSGNLLINHLNTGCSPNGYADYTNDPSLTATLVAGQTYNFTSTANFSSQRIKIWIDFNRDGVFDDATELLYESPSGANPVIGSFTIPHNATGNTTVMRVFDRYSSLPTSACDTNVSFGEVHDYKVTIVGASMICESPRVEVFATVSQSGDKLVGALNYTDTDNTVNYGNNFSGTPGCDYTLNYLDGNDIVYKYSPVTDDIINIELTNVTNNSTGVFVYQSCGDVGTNCLAG